MHLGGFVIHGNAASTLGPCLDSLGAVCDEVVAVDSESTDGSRALCAARGVRSVVHPWRGYGAARAFARTLLPRADYLFYLDADEWLEAQARSAVGAWRSTRPALPHYSLGFRDWATLRGRRFVFRTHRRNRLFRADCACWEDGWVVHEALPRRQTAHLAAWVEHDFVRSLPALEEKLVLYARLWAVRAHAAGKWSWPVPGRGLWSALGLALVRGALVRGGAAGWELSWCVGRYHALKHQALGELRRGLHAEAAALYARGAFPELVAWARRPSASSRKQC